MTGERLSRAGGNTLLFFCPGCQSPHPFDTNRRTWNQSMEKPTFSPSLLCNAHDPSSRCHSFVTDGKIQFLDDCHHELRGQTVDIPEWDSWGENPPPPEAG